MILMASIFLIGVAMMAASIKALIREQQDFDNAANNFTKNLQFTKR